MDSTWHLLPPLFPSFPIFFVFFFRLGPQESRDSTGGGGRNFLEKKKEGEKRERTIFLFDRRELELKRGEGRRILLTLGMFRTMSPKGRERERDVTWCTRTRKCSLRVERREIIGNSWGQPCTVVANLTALFTFFWSRCNAFASIADYT